MKKKNKLMLMLGGTAALIVAGSSMLFKGTGFSVNGDSHITHSGNHYVRLDPTASSTGIKEYVVCCDCHEHFVAEENEFFMSPGYSTETLIQFKILGKRVFPKKDFLAEEEGFKIIYGEGSVHAGWFGGTTVDGDGYSYIAANGLSNVGTGSKFIIKKGSFVTSTDEKVYYIPRDIVATYNGTSWVGDEVYTATGKTGEAQPGDDRYIPLPGTKVDFKLGWSTDSNVQFTFLGGETIDEASDGQRFTIADTTKVETNIPNFADTLRIWNSTTFGIDPTTVGGTLPNPAYVIFKKGFTISSPAGQTFELDNELCITYAGGEWKVYDTATKGVVDSVTCPGISGAVGYISPKGTNLMSYASGTNPGGIIPSQAQYTGSIKFCGVEVNDLRTFSPTIHLFGTIIGAGWNDATLSFRIYDNDTWVEHGYSPLSSFEGYDFGDTITYEIKAGTVIELTEGNGGTYLFKNDASFVYTGAAWSLAE